MSDGLGKRFAAVLAAGSVVVAVAAILIPIAWDVYKAPSIDGTARLHTATPLLESAQRKSHAEYVKKFDDWSMRVIEARATDACSVKLPPRPLVDGISSPNSVWEIELRNAGRATAQGIRLRVPEARTAVYPNQTRLRKTKGGAFVLDDLAPGDAIKVFSWCRYRCTQEPSVSFEGGRGAIEVEVWGPEPNRYWTWFSWVSLIVSAFFGGQWLASTRRSKEFAAELDRVTSEYDQHLTEMGDAYNAHLATLAGGHVVESDLLRTRQDSRPDEGAETARSTEPPPKS